MLSQGEIFLFVCFVLGVLGISWLVCVFIFMILFIFWRGIWRYFRRFGVCLCWWLGMGIVYLTNSLMMFGIKRNLLGEGADAYLFSLGICGI